MYTGAERLTDRLPARPAWRADQVVPRNGSPAVGIAIYFLGVIVESVGLGIVAAYGLLALGGAIWICGLAIGLLGNRLWPAPAQAVSSFAFLRESLGRSRDSRHHGPYPGGRGRL